MATTAPPQNCTCASESSTSIPGWLVETFGYTGGALLAFALLPQIWRTYKLRSARDVSYMWQAIYSAGLVFTMVYLIFKKALAAWVFIVVELFFGIVFVLSKIYFEQFARRSKNVSFGLTFSCFGGVEFDDAPAEAVARLLDEAKSVLKEMSFQHTHQFVKALGEHEAEPNTLRGMVHGFIYTNNFTLELRYVQVAQQLLVQINSHRELTNISELSDRLDRHLAAQMAGSFLLNHGTSG